MPGNALTPPDPPRLHRTLGLVGCTFTGVGVILGAGIYALVGKAASLAGSSVWIAFAGSALMAGLTGLGYAELASFIPRAGGEYHYAQRAFGTTVAFLVSWLLLAGLAIACAAVALGFAGYLSSLLAWPEPVTAAALIVLCAVILIWGIRESVGLVAFCTTAEVLGLLLIIFFGIPKLGTVDLLDAPAGASGIASAAALIFFAYIGFEEIVQLAEETREPTQTIPRAVLLSIAIATVLYVAVATASVSVLGAERLGASKAPLADVAAAAVGPRAGQLLVGIALMSTFNTALVLLMSSARLLWGIADDGTLPAPLARVHSSRGTPWVATCVVSAFAVVIALSLERIELVTSVTNFSLFATFLAINGAVVVLRFREPDVPRPFRLPGAIWGVPVIPLLGIGAVVVLIVYVGVPAITLGSAILAVGLAVRAFTKRRPAHSVPNGARNAHDSQQGM